MAAYRETIDFPRSEQFGLTAQMRRAAVSIATNLVEGSARDSKLEYIRFIEIAYSSACELEYQVTVARRLRYFNEMTVGTIESNAQEVTRVIAGLLKSLRTPRSETP